MAEHTHTAHTTLRISFVKPVITTFNVITTRLQWKPHEHLHK